MKKSYHLRAGQMMHGAGISVVAAIIIAGCASMPGTLGAALAAMY